MSDRRPVEVDMDELRKGVEKVIAFGNPSTPQKKKAEEEARHRFARKRRKMKAPTR